jgi:hypothetical protein
MGAISDADARVHRSVVLCSYDGKPRWPMLSPFELQKRACARVRWAEAASAIDCTVGVAARFHG